MENLKNEHVIEDVQPKKNEPSLWMLFDNHEEI